MEESLPRASVVKLAKASLPPKTRLSPALVDLLHESADHLVRSLASRAAAAAESEADGEGGERGKRGAKKTAGGVRKPAAVEHTHVATALDDLGARHLQAGVDEAVDAVNAKSQKKAKRRKKLSAEEQAEAEAEQDALFAAAAAAAAAADSH